jgi:hypothetical protein
VGGTVVSAAQQHHGIDVGGASVLPSWLVVGVAPLGGHVAAGEHAPAVTDGEGAALRVAGESARASQPERLASSIDQQGAQVGVAAEQGGELCCQGLAVQGTHTLGCGIVGLDDHDGLGACGGAGGEVDGGTSPEEGDERSGAELTAVGHGCAGRLVLTPGVTPLLGCLGGEDLADELGRGPSELALKAQRIAGGRPDRHPPVVGFVRVVVGEVERGRLP